MPSTLKRIEYRTFENCHFLRTIELPDGLEYLGKYCFYNSGLENIRIPPVLKTIETMTFYECKNLRHVEFSEGLEKIDFNAFYENGIRRVDLPSSTRRIGAEAFTECANLHSVQLNEGLETLGTDELTPEGEHYLGVFEESGLRDVRFPSTLKRIECRAFAECENLKVIELPDGLEYLGEHCFLRSGLESIKIPPALKVIEV